jgi:hypothetical protein
VQEQASFGGYVGTAVLLLAVVLALYIQRLRALFPPVEESSLEESYTEETSSVPESD